MFNFFALTIMIHKYYYLFTRPSVIVVCWKSIFSSLFNFFGANNLDYFWMREHWGQKLYGCQGWKFAHEIPLGQVSYCGIWIAKPHWRPASRIAHLVKIPFAASPMKLYYFRHSRSTIALTRNIRASLQHFYYIKPME